MRETESDEQADKEENSHNFVSKLIVPNRFT